MSAISPTCLPWQVKHDFDLEGTTTIIGNVDGEIIDGTTHNTYDFVCATLDHLDDSQSRSVAVANAEFIVRACNNHTGLIEALRQYRSDMLYPPAADSRERRVQMIDKLFDALSKEPTP